MSPQNFDSTTPSTTKRWFFNGSLNGLALEFSSGTTKQNQNSRAWLALATNNQAPKCCPRAASQKWLRPGAVTENRQYSSLLERCTNVSSASRELTQPKQHQLAAREIPKTLDCSFALSKHNKDQGNDNSNMGDD